MSHAVGADGGVSIEMETCPPTAPSATRRLVRVALFGCGAALVLFLFLRIGPTAVLGSFRQLSWRLLIVIVFPCVALKALDTLAWRFAFPDDRVPLPALATALLAGQAVGSTPASAIGGNATMAWTLRPRVSLRESFSSLIIVQTTSTASQGLFLLLGILVARHAFPLASALVRIMECLLVLEVIAVVGFIAVQLRGLVASGHGVLRRLGLAGAASRLAATSIDDALVAFYRHQPRRLGLSLACNFLGWLTRAGETWTILYFLHAAVPIGTALVIEAFGTGISFATFFLPMDLGVEEGGAVAAFVALGLGAATGLSFGLVRRIRELAWTALGLLLLAGKPRPSLAALGAQPA